MIITNKVSLDFNKKNIDRDFDIFKLEKEDDEKKHIFESNVLDLPQEDFQAKSVVYTFGSIWYVLFDKKQEINKRKFKKVINEKSDREGSIRVEKLDVFQDEIDDYILAKLLFNKLYIDDDEKSYRNITGKLFYQDKKWIERDKQTHEINSFYCIKIDLDKNMYFSFEVSTFSNVKFHKNKDIEGKPRYIIDDNGVLRRKLENKYDRKDTYVNKSSNPARHNSVKFLDFNNPTKFNESKVGIYTQFLEDVEDELSDYIKIKLEGYENYKTISAKLKYGEKNYKKLLNGKDIIIQDLVNNNKSEEAIRLIKQELYNQFNIEAKIGELDPNNFNLRIIHNNEYYEENNLKDPHNQVDPKIIIQHQTIESFNEMMKQNKNKKNEEKSIQYHPVTKMVQELIIKENIRKKRISLVNWSEFKYDTPVVFAMRDRIFDNKNKKEKKYIYTKLIIYPDGILDLKVHDEREKHSLKEELFGEFEAIEKLYQTWNKRTIGEVEGVFYKLEDSNQLDEKAAVIVKTNEFAMPNFKELKEILSKTNKKEKLQTSKILCCVEEFYKLNKDSISKVDRERLKEIINELKKMNSYETRKDINGVMKMGTNIGKGLNDYIKDKTGIIINPRLKQFTDENVYFDSIVNIKYIEEENDIVYFIGIESNNLNGNKINTSFIIRKIVNNKDIKFEDIEKLLRVDFVKNKHITVIPFPFKYAREILKMYI